MSNKTDWKSVVQANPALAESLKPKMTKYIKQTPTPKQAAFMLVPHFEALFGGAASPGKTSAILMCALQYVDVPGYSALILRKSYADLNLPNAIMDRAKTWLMNTDAKWYDKDKTFRFPSGATLTFGYLDNPNDRYRYQGSEYQFCVAEGTPVLMGSGEYKNIEEIRVGDIVQTLNGPQAVTREFPVRKAECVRLDILSKDGSVEASQTHSFDHSILTDQGWISYADKCDASHPSATSSPTQCCVAQESVLSSEKQSRTLSQKSCGQQLDRQRQLGPSQESLDHQDRGAANDVFRASDQTDFLKSDDARREGQQPQKSSAHQELHEQTPRQCQPLFQKDTGLTPNNEVLCGQTGSSTEGFQSGCRSCSGFYDGRLLPDQGIAQPTLPLRVYVVERSHTDSEMDDLDCAPQYNRTHPLEYAHPYTKEIRRSDLCGDLRTFAETPVGEKNVYDIRVGTSSHYITQIGLVNRNCGFDELTQFDKYSYEYLFSRLRKTKDIPVPLRMRCATNPGGVGGEWVKKRFVDTSSSPDRVFVRAKIDDNPYINKEEYVRSLNQLDPVTQAQLLEGDWDVRRSGLVYPTLAKNYPEGCVVPKFAPPRGQVFGGIDWGFTGPACFLCGTLDEDNVLWIWYERYIRGQTVQEHMDCIPQDNNIIWFADPAQPELIQQMRHRDFIVRKAPNARLSGIDIVTSRIRQGKLRVSEDCKALIDESQLYRHRDDRDVKPDEVSDPDRGVREEPIKKYDHACFVASTPIKTIDCEKQICDVKRGDLVLTRNGYCKVTESKMTGMAFSTLLIILSNGRSVRCTYNHPIYSVDSSGSGQFVRADSLEVGSKVLSTECESNDSRPESASSTRESDLSDTQTQTTELNETTTSPMLATENLASNDCTKRYGRTLTEKFLKGGTFTTKTETRSTTICRILNVFRQVTTTVFMQKILPALLRSRYTKSSRLTESLPPNGTQASQDASGTPITQNSNGPKSRSLPSSASGAGSPIKPECPGKRCTAAVHADSVTETTQKSTTSCGHVLTAEQSSRSTNTHPSNFALVTVREIQNVPEIVPVYNLTINDCSEYFAGSVLVHNCDALKYLCAGISKMYGLEMPSIEALTTRAAEIAKNKPLELLPKWKPSTGMFKEEAEFRKQHGEGRAWASDEDFKKWNRIDNDAFWGADSLNLTPDF